MAILESLIVCDGVGGVVNSQGKTLPKCDWGSLITLVRVLINDMIIISSMMVVIVLCYAGFILLTSGGNPAALTRAKTMFWKIIIGYVWILAAWLIVYTITKVLLEPGYSLLGPPK